MYPLDKNQVERIAADVEAARITLSHLSAELVDHICCEVEMLMSEGKNFEEAYEIMKEQTGIKVLQKVQENTLYLIDKKYAFMKTGMKITGNISVALLGFGTLFKIFHWPGANIIMGLGFILLCLVFFPAAIYISHYRREQEKYPLLHLSILVGGIAWMAGVFFKVLHWPGAAFLLFSGWALVLFVFLPLLAYHKVLRAERGREKVIYITGIIGLLVFELASMFKFFHWPGAGVLLFTGSVLLTGICLPAYTYMRLQQSRLTHASFVYLITLTMYVVVMTALMAVNPSSSVSENFEQQAKDDQRINLYFEQKRENHPDQRLAGPLKKYHEQVTAEAEGLRDSIRSLRLSLLYAGQQTDNDPAKVITTDLPGLKQKEKMISLDAAGLKRQLNQFREHACKAVAADPELSRSIAFLLSTEGSYKDGDSIRWEELYFNNTMLMGAISFLNHIEKKVNRTESETLRHLYFNNL